MPMKVSRAQRAAAIEDAIARFENRDTTGSHDGRLIDANLGTEAGFGGSEASRRQQVQQYFKEFPHLRDRWHKLVAAHPPERREPPERIAARQLRHQRQEVALLRSQLEAMDLVADVLRRKNQRLERELAQARCAQAEMRRTTSYTSGSSEDNVLSLHNNHHDEKE